VGQLVSRKAIFKKKTSLFKLICLNDSNHKLVFSIGDTASGRAAQIAHSDIDELLQTHSAYMLFYERMKVGETSSDAAAEVSPPDTVDGSSAVCRLDADDDDRHKIKIELSPELAEVLMHCLPLFKISFVDVLCHVLSR